MRQIHLSLIDYICISGNMERNVLEYVECVRIYQSSTPADPRPDSHLHEHFLFPVSINDQGRYNIPTEAEAGYSIEMYESSMRDYSFPKGAYWVADAKGEEYKSERDAVAH